LNFRNNLWLLYKNLPGNQLFYILFMRMILDGVAALKLVGELNFNGISSVLKAHYHFYKSLNELHRRRMSVLRDKEFIKPKEMLHKSIVFQFYVKKKKRFSDINF
ncbi:MAG: hypothetical protein ACM3O8_13395, partial [Methylococcaceae bacterium]